MRDNLHIVIYAMIFFFALLVVLEWGMSFSETRGRVPGVGKVNDDVISIAEYDGFLKQYRENYQKQSGVTEMDEQTELRLEDNVWETLIYQKLAEQVMNKEQIKVLNEEIVQTIYSPNPPQVISRNFRDTKTGQIDKEKLKQAIEDPQNKQAWIQIEESIRRERSYMKLQDLIAATVHSSIVEAKKSYEMNANKVAGKYVFFPLSMAKPDASYSISDNQVESEYKKNLESYRQKPTREAKFVFFTLQPSKEDSTERKKELEVIKADFEKSTNDSEFVKMYSERSLDFTKKLDASLLKANKIFINIKTLKKGNVIGVYKDGNDYKLFKVVKASNVVKASHILIKPSGSSQAELNKALAKANGLLKKVKKGGNFAELAKANSDEPAAKTSGGDLGWFGTGSMVKEFEAAVLTKKKGDIVGPIKTQFGYHIIKVTGADSVEVIGAEVVKKITPSSATMEKTRMIASEFEVDAERQEFETIAAEKKLPIRETGSFQRNSFIPIIGYSREVSNFAFRSLVGKVSHVIQTVDGYVLVKVTKISDEEFKPLTTEIKEQIKKTLITEEQKKDLIVLANETLQKVGGDFAKLKSTNPNVTEGSIPLTGSSSSFQPTLGTIDNAFLALIATDVNKISPPVKTTLGVALFYITEKKIVSNEEFAVEQASTIKKLDGEKSAEITRNWVEGLKRKAKIEDLRSKIF